MRNTSSGMLFTIAGTGLAFLTGCQPAIQTAPNGTAQATSRTTPARAPSRRILWIAGMTCPF